MNISYIDIVISICLIYGLFRGLYKGFIIELASLAALIMGIYVAVNFSSFVGSILHKYISVDEKYFSIISFCIIFIGVVIGIFLIGKILNKVVNILSLGIINKILGGGFGLLKTAFIIGVIIFIFNSFNNRMQMVEQKTLNKSILYTPLLNLSSILLGKSRLSSKIKTVIKS